MAEPVRVAMIELRFVGGDLAQIKERIDAGLEVLNMLVGGFDEHHILGRGDDDDEYLAPEESATFIRYLMQEPEA